VTKVQNRTASRPSAFIVRSDEIGTETGEIL